MCKHPPISCVFVVVVKTQVTAYSSHIFRNVLPPPTPYLNQDAMANKSQCHNTFRPWKWFFVWLTWFWSHSHHCQTTTRTKIWRIIINHQMKTLQKWTTISVKTELGCNVTPTFIFQYILCTSLDCCGFSFYIVCLCVCVQYLTFHHHSTNAQNFSSTLFLFIFVFRVFSATRFMLCIACSL